ncbi:MAG: cadherin domain-containing protein, partial [Cyclobacteriaceae bacterium]
STSANGAYSVYSSDLDGDGDMDVLSTSGIDDKIVCYRNDYNPYFISIDENSELETISLSEYTIDPENDALSFTIISGNESEGFTLSSSGELSSNSATFDFEANTEISLAISASDGLLQDSGTFRFKINDINEAPFLVVDSVSIDENSKLGKFVHAILADDPEEDNLSYTLVSGNINNAFSLSKAGILRVNNQSALDFETTPEFSLEITVSDEKGGTDTKFYKINLNDIDESKNTPPTIYNQSFVIDENAAFGTNFGTVVSTDPDEDDLAFYLLSGNTNNAFDLNAVSGVFTVQTQSALDFETTPSFLLEVEINDGNGGLGIASITIYLNDIDESNNNSPVIDNQSFSIDENSLVGNSVTTIVSTDLDEDVLFFSILSGNIDNAFTINAKGELIVSTQSALDFETTAQFILEVEVNDGNGGIDTAKITIDLNDIDESNNSIPSIVNQSFDIDENSPEGTSVGTIIAYDPNADELIYSILSGNHNDTFELNPNTGILTVRSTASLNYEFNHLFILEVEVFDGRGGLDVAVVTVSIDDINESPIISDESFSLDENSPFDMVIDTIKASDQDNDVLSFSINSGNESGAFGIDMENGELFIADSSAFDYEVNPIFTIEVQVSDGEFKDVATITIVLNDVDETVAGLPYSLTEEIKLYPNPSSSQLTIKVKELNKFNLKAIHDINGKKINSYVSWLMNDLNIDVSSFVPGIYFILFEYKGMYHAMKFQKE